MLAKMPEVKGYSSLLPPTYSPGHVLMDDDLTAAVVYTRNLSRLLFRSLFGCGVICGYKLVPKLECERLKITVDPGVALDCHGDPVELTAAKALCVGEACDDKIPDQLWVIIRATEHACAPRELACPSDDEDDACGCHATRAQAGYEIKVVGKLPCGVCGCGEVKAAPTIKGTTEFGTIGDRTMRVAPPTTALDLNTAGRAQLDILNRDVEQSRAKSKLLATNAADLRKKLAPLDRAGADLLGRTLEAEKAAGMAGAAQEVIKQAQDLRRAFVDHQAQFAEARSNAEAAAASADLESLKTSALAKRVEDHRAMMGEAYMALESGGQAAAADCCALNAPRSPCHENHYGGVCSCCCGDGCDGWVVLGSVVKDGKPADPDQPYVATYGDRRFIRPMLAADPFWSKIA